MQKKMMDFLESGIGIVVVIIFITVAFAVIGLGRRYITKGTDEFTKTGDAALDTVYTKYEGDLKGSQVQSAIKEFVNDENIWVSYVSASGATQSVNYADGTAVLNGNLLATNSDVVRKMNKKTEAQYYINPNTNYYGEIVREDQGIVGIRFTIN